MEAPEWVDMLVDEYGAEFVSPQECMNYNLPLEFLYPSSGVGNLEGVLDELFERLSAQGVDFLTNTTAKAFVLNSEGSISGMRLVSGVDNGYLHVRAKRIVLATGGYAGSQAMVRKYVPDQVEAGSIAYASDGEMLRLLTAREMQVADMELTMPMIGDAPQASVWGVFGPTMCVNAAAQRFAAEDDPHAAAFACYANEEGSWWTIFDNQICEGFLSASVAETLSTYSKRVVGPCETVSELAEACNLPAEALQETFKEYAEVIEAKEDKAYGRKRGLVELAPPYYAIRQMPRRFRSYGGMKVNENFQPLSSANLPLENVFCCGALIASTEDGLSACGTSGFLAGRKVVASL